MRGSIRREVCTSVALSLLGLALLTSSASGAGWKTMPVVPAFDAKVRASFERDLKRSRELSMRSRVFAKVGDSNTEMGSALYGLGCSTPRLAGHSYLRPTIERFNAVRLPNVDPMPGCDTSTSFSRHSAATRAASHSSWYITKVRDLEGRRIARPPVGCDPDETPLDCEVRITRPRYVLIMTGTNDFHLDAYFGEPAGRLAAKSSLAMVRRIRQLGSVPVLSTLPPVLTPRATFSTIFPYNRAIAGVARRTGTPLINLWRGLARPGMHNWGMGSFGLHLGTFVDSDSTNPVAGATVYRDSVDFRPEALRFGANRRNLIWLKTLARLDRVAGSFGF